MASFTHLIRCKILCRAVSRTAWLRPSVAGVRGLFLQQLPGVVTLVCLGLFTTLNPGAAQADEWIDSPSIRAEGSTLQSNSFVAQPSLTAAEAAAKVRREHGGRVLSVNPARRGDALGYRVRVLIDGGRVKTLYVGSGLLSGPVSGSVSGSGDGSGDGSAKQADAQAEPAPRRPRSRVRTIGER